MGIESASSPSAILRRSFFRRYRFGGGPIVHRV
jgi:hypothetical protein